MTHTHTRESQRENFGTNLHLFYFILVYFPWKFDCDSVPCLIKIFRFARVGSVVLALHDASDVFLEIGKMSKYSGAETVASFAFILFVLSWIILRLIYYPFWILWSTRFVLFWFPIYILSLLSVIYCGPHLPIFVCS